ncbi:hypothetical protein D3C75_707170 [compost metagenome]
MTYGDEQGHSSQGRNRKRQNHTQEGRKFSGSIDSRRFQNALRQTLYERADNNHIEYTDDTGNDVHPEAVGQAQILDQQISRDKASAEIHGEYEKHGDELAQHIILAA